ncbi:MAG: hypothetical protein LJE87_10890, partial [Deltaproteobacteria bacterium]|nr:hypothetical protein [Deltaproteobacteria bacterium]
MPKSNRKKRLNTTIDDDLLKQFKILAVQEDKRLNQLLEESIRDVLAKYDSDPSMPTKRPAPKPKKRKQEEPDLNSLSLHGVETTLQEVVSELKETRRAVEKGPKKVSSFLPALTGLVAGLILASVFLTANYTDLLRYKFDLDARAIMLSQKEDHFAKATEAGVIRDSIIDESRELRAVGIDGQTQLSGLQPQGMANGTVVSQLEPTLPTTAVTSAGILAAPEIPSLDELFRCKLGAIAWDENPDQRLAVLDDRILHEGDVLA